MSTVAGSVPQVVVLVVATVSPACAPSSDGAPGDGSVETAHLRITTSEENPICAGTAPLLEREVVRIAEALELPLWPENDKLDVRLGKGAVEDLCDGIEIPNVGGCIEELDGGIVLAADNVAIRAPHELVHAVRHYNLALVPRMFEEGLAQILSGSDGFPLFVEYPRGPGWPGPAELVEIPPPEFHGGYYVVSQSFLSWLWLTYGRSKLMALVNDPRLADGDAAALFEEYYGFSLSDAEQGWIDEDGPDPVWGDPCPSDRTFVLAGDFELASDLDCSDPGVYGATPSMSVMPMCLVIPETTRVRISLLADHGRLSILGREPCDPGPTSAEARQDKYIEAGETIEQDIAGCRYRMLLSSQEPGFPSTEYTIRIDQIAG